MQHEEWTRSGWRAFPARQQPVWPDIAVRDETLWPLSQLPPLVFAGESRTLRELLAEAVDGRAFVLQCGDCSEDFSRCAGRVHLELTGENVTECTGGSRQLLDHHLHLNYQTTCDPRLNAEQSVELAFELSELLHP